MRLAAFSIILLLAAAASPRARAQDAGWVRADADDAVAADNPATADRLQFGNNFQNNGMDQWCDSLPFTIPISQDITTQLGQATILSGGAFNGNRQFFRYPNGDVAINDQLELKLDTGYSLAWVWKAEKALGFFVGGSIDGQTLVTRPIHGADSCKALKRFYDPLDFKMVVPLNAKRLSRMDVGELWIIPMTFQIAFEPVDAGDAPAWTGRFKGLPSAAYLSIGASRTSDPTITVYRAGPREIRLKLHLDRVAGFSVQAGGMVGAIPATDIGTPGLETLLSRVLPTLLPSDLLLFSRQIDSILGGTFSASYAKNKGQQVFLQYTLDPQDPAQMELLVRAIRGDLSVLRALKDFVSIGGDASSPAMSSDLSGMRQRQDAVLKSVAELAGIDDYKNSSAGMSLSLPVVFSYSGGTTRSQDHYVMQAPQARDIYSYKLQKQSTVGFVNFPMVGSLISHSRARGTQVLLDAGAARNLPYLVFTQEWGLLRARGSAAQKAVAQADGLMSEIGTDSSAEEPTGLPQEMLDAVAGRSYHKGYMDLALVLGPEAVGKILSASTTAALDAFKDTLNSLDSGLFGYILQRGDIAADGRVSISRKELAGYAPYSHGDERDQDDIVGLAWQVCRRASKFLKDLAAAREASGQRQAQALFKLASGKGSLSRDDFMKIALRLVSPQDVSGDVLLHLDADKTSAANYTVRYVLNPMSFADPALKAMSVVERGFIAPTPSAPLED